MTNKQIIRAAAERLDPATLHQIATAHHTPEEIAAVAASCKIVDKDGNEKPATAADIEIMFAADELHTFDYSVSCCQHFPDDPYCFSEQTGPFSLQTGAFPCNAQVLTG